MNTNTLHTRRVIAAAFFCLLSVLAQAQNTYTPNPIHVTNPAFTWDPTVFSERVPAFSLGSQWGASTLDKVNTALKLNVTSGDFGYMWQNGGALDTNAQGRLINTLSQLYKLGNGYKDTNFVIWGSPMISTPEHIDFSGKWIGMRWEPSESDGMSSTWTPRDADAWPFSFAAKHHHTITSDTSNANYRRTRFTKDPQLTYPVKVLDSVEPRNQMYMMRGVNWTNPLLEKFINRIDSIRDSVRTFVRLDTVYHEDTTDARRLRLVVNLRRANAADVVVDDSVVASIVVPYQMRWKDQDTANNDYEPRRLRMPFDSIPRTSVSTPTTITLPQSRGREMRMQAPPGGYSDSIIITRGMLPLHSDPLGPDITIVAEFRTDTIVDFVLGVPNRRPHILKTGPFDYPSGSDTDSVLRIADTAGLNKRYMAIDTLGITVWHHGTTSPVAIRALSLLTPQTKNATSGYWDATWATALKMTVDSIKKVQTKVDSLTHRKIKLLGFYVADEFGIEHLVGMRYRLDYLDRRLTSEIGLEGARSHNGNFATEFGPQKLHGFPTRMVWSAGLTLPSRPTAAPYFGKQPQSEGACASCARHPLPTMGFKLGYKRGNGTAPYRDHETRIDTKISGGYTAVDLPLPTAPPFNYTTTAAYEGMMHSKQSDVGLMAMHESSLYTHMYQTGSWYFSKRRDWWANHFYHLDMEYRLDDSGRPYVQHVKFQPITGESVRLAHGAELALGCRGFMYDKWRNHAKNPPLSSTLNAAERLALKGQRIFPSTDPEVTLASGVSSGDYFPGYVTEDSTARIWDTSAAVTVDSLFRSLHIGGDYYTDDDLYGIDSWTSLDTLAKYMEVNRCIPNDPVLHDSSKHIYVGRKSVQMETKWWHDLVTDTSRYFKYGKDSSNAYYFMLTRPVGWFAKGYKTLTNGDVMRLGKWLDPSASNVRLQRWTRKSSTDSTLVLEDEPTGEKLYDIVLMDVSLNDTAKADDNCIIAVTNRRTSPHLFNLSLADSVEFMSSYDFDTLTRYQKPELRYKQVGARRITLPFDYKIDVSKPYLLHVRELRPAYDSPYTIDTIINWKSNLTVDFRPGETRYFRITRQQATDTVDAGYLAFSTQNKMVAYPVAKADNSGFTDSVRYHMVFHRRDTATQTRGTPWTVYYQRSVPYHRDSLPLVAGLTWEATIRLSGLTTLSIPHTDSPNLTLRDLLDPGLYDERVAEHSAAAKDCSCGFPSIVVREVDSFVPKVFVVYTCEDMWANVDVRGTYFHVVENAFLDDAILNPATLDANGKSLVVCGKTPGLGDTLNALSKFGTPVINASSANIMYYAWSSLTRGIGVGTKLGTADWFPAADAIANVPNVDIDVDAVRTLTASEALYPSLNVYSNIAQHRVDATLVWQEEGDLNRHIRYTRLIPGVGTAIARMLPDFTAMAYTHWTPPSIPVNNAAAIAVVGGATEDEEAGFPVVVRSLQRDTMSMVIRDTVGDPYGFPYNHETIAYEEYKVSELRSRVRYYNFIDRYGFGLLGTNELRYWTTVTTYCEDSSLFHPVITNGKVRLDSLTWEGIVDDSLITYNERLKIMRGDISDSSIVVNYSLLPTGSYNNLKVQKEDRNSTYWLGQDQFASLIGQQIEIRRMPGVPAPVSVALDLEFLRTKGAWMHLAMREREDMPNGISAVRRIMQHTSGPTPPPSLVASAEQFYKLGDGGIDDGLDEDSLPPPSVSGGIEVRGHKLTTRAVLSDGRSISFRPVYEDVMPRGYTGSKEYAWQVASISTPVRELVSETFTVGDVGSMKLLTSGLLRDDVQVSIEEVDPASEQADKHGKITYTNFKEPKESFQMTLTQADAEKPDAITRDLYYLTSGEDKHYRLRMKYLGTAGVIFREDLDVAPARETFEKAGSEAVRIIDLEKMKGTELGMSADLRVYPNPSSERVTIIVDAMGLSPDIIVKGQLVLDVVDGVGRVVISGKVSLGEVVEFQGLPSGVYVARVRLEGVAGATVKASGSFTVVK